jgi:hypothetical protein
MMGGRERLEEAASPHFPVELKYPVSSGLQKHKCANRNAARIKTNEFACDKMTNFVDSYRNVESRN